MVYIRLFFAVLSIVMIIGHFIYSFLLKRKIGSTKVYENISRKREGIKCYSCSEIIISDAQEAVNRIIDGVEDLTLCQSCKRDVRLTNLLNTNSNSFLDFKKWIISKKSEKFMFVGLIFPLLFMMISFIFSQKIFGVASFINNIYLTIYWSIMWYRVYLNRK